MIFNEIFNVSFRAACLTLSLSLSLSLSKEHVTNIFWHFVPLIASVQSRRCILLIGGLMVRCHSIHVFVQYCVVQDYY